MPLLIHYPEHPIADARPANSDELRELVATARANAIPFQLRYPAPSGAPFRYHSSGARFCR